MVCASGAFTHSRGVAVRGSSGERCVWADLLYDYLAAINNVDALGGVRHAMALEVVEFMLFFDDGLLNAHLLVGEGYDGSEAAPRRGSLVVF